MSLAFCQEKLTEEANQTSLLEEAVSVVDGTVRIDFCVMDTVPSAQQIFHGMSLPITEGKVTDSGGTLHELYSVETASIYVAKIRITS